MSKLKSAILYEYSTKIKAMVLFYLIQYLIVALIFSIVAISVGGEEIGSNALEFSSVIFISVIGLQRRFQSTDPKWIYAKIYLRGYHLYVHIAGRNDGAYRYYNR